MAHTPGPWNRGYGNFVYQGAEVDFSAPNPQRLIATCMPLNGTSEELNVIFSNARLIACAPELLEACKMAVEIIKDSYGEDQISDGDCQACNVLLKAISKAEGKQ